MKHESRKRRVTSSNAYKLIKKDKRKMTKEELSDWKRDNPKSRVTTCDGDGFGSEGETYIKEKRLERKLNRSMSLNVYNRSIAWGHLMEHVCFDKLELGYELVSQDTINHHDPEFADGWRGTPDYIVAKQVISEQKSYQLKGFAEYSDCLMKKDIAIFREEYPKEYWQIVSNCCINNYDIGEAISFMPYKSTLEKLREALNETDCLEEWGFGHEMWKYRYIHEAPIRDLPWIEEGGHYQEITRFRFVVPDEDKAYLTQRVRKALTLINE